MNEGLTLLIAIYLKTDNSTKTDNTMLYVLFLSLLANGHKQDIQNRLRLTRDILNHNFGDTTLKQIKQNLKIKILILGQHKLLPEKIIITTVSIRHML
jgi:hypothetical protein